jgi:hypothetical protein
MAIRFAAKDEPKSAPAKADKAKARVDRKVEAAETQSTAESDLFDAAPKTPTRKRKKK